MLEETHRLVALVMAAAAEREDRWRTQTAGDGTGITERRSGGPSASKELRAADRRAHLDRLADLAGRDHEAFTRPDGRPEYR